jgi:hypothetical protein
MYMWVAPTVTRQLKITCTQMLLERLFALLLQSLLLLCTSNSASYMLAKQLLVM